MCLTRSRAQSPPSLGNVPTPHLTDEESETDGAESLAQGYPAGSGGPGLLNDQYALPLRFG